MSQEESIKSPEEVSRFSEEEKYCLRKFLLNLKSGYDLVNRFCSKIEQMIKASNVKIGDNPNFSIALHCVLSLMSTNNGLFLLSHGYMGDFEAVHKRVVEFFLRAIYFREFPDEERKWRENKEKTIDRKSMAEKLDERNQEHRIFSTDYKHFFSKFIHEVVYKTTNEWAHGDFEMMYRELARELDTQSYPSKFSMGPRFDQNNMKIMLKSLLHSCILQVLFLADTFKYPQHYYHDLVIQAKKHLLENEIEKLDKSN